MVKKEKFSIEKVVSKFYKKASIYLIQMINLFCSRKNIRRNWVGRNFENSWINFGVKIRSRNPI